MEFAEQPLDAIPNISSVPGQVLAQICDHIQDPEDLLAFSSTCSLFRSSAAHSRAWLSFCRRRWGGGASPQVLFPRKVADYKTLFLSSNGWRGKCKLTPAHAFSDCVEYAALHCVAPCELDQDPDAYAVAVSNQGTNRMELFRLRGGKQRLENGETCEQGDADPQYKAEVVQSARLLFSDPHPSPICSIKMDRSGSLIVAGRCDGTLSTYRPSKDSENWMDEGVFLLPMDVPPYPISSLELNEWAGLTYALVDRGECGAWHPNRNGCTMVVDPSVTGPPAAKLHEVVDAYDLCAFQPVGEGGSDVLAASVKISQDRWLDGICPSCDPQLPASMCHHQHRSAAAALVTFDARANVPGGLVARHALPHRSIMPCLQVAREHYVMLSHAGEPLVIWDRRQELVMLF